MPLPSGTITFLFTDVQGSTKLWEQHPDAMRMALARHDVLLRQAIEDNSGVVFKTVGDAFCAAFATAPDALAAALAAHLLLLNEEWGETGALRVRMGLHTGEAEERDGDYFGQTLNRVARLQAVGHGQQTLLSQATYQLVSSSLSPDVKMRDMGQQRLKDLLAPEHVWQLLHPALPAEFPPLKSLDYLPTNLPRQMTSFIGREREMGEVKRLLAATPLLTLVGSGGCGKTRLAVQVGADVLENYKDGVWLVELAALSDASLVPQAVASVLGLREEAGRPLLQTVQDHLRERNLLLLLDNCEHLLPACAHLADALLKNCPDLKIVASSRERLDIAGEQTYRVPSLNLPPILSAAQSLPAQTAHTYEAVRLFADRGMLVKPEFMLTDANAAVIAQVCRRLDGIPLAIELAAARVRSLPVEQIAIRLDDRFRLLTGGTRTALPRQQTLRALIEWSYDLLSAQEKALLHRLAVFAGGWTLEAAEAVCAGERIEDWEVFDLLTSLVDKSLVLYEEPEGQARYRLLETVREYALERLKEIGADFATRSQHLEYFLHWAEATEPQLHGSEQVIYLNHLEREHDNLRAALDWSQMGDGGEEKGLRLALALCWFWQIHSHHSEGRSRLNAMLTWTEASGREIKRAQALQGIGLLAFYQNEYSTAHTLLQESVTLFREAGDERGLTFALVYYGGATGQIGERQTGSTLLQESIGLAREINDRWSLAMGLWLLGTYLHFDRNYTAARPVLEESVLLFRALGDIWGLSGPLYYLGEMQQYQGEYQSARAYIEEALVLVRQVGDKWRESAFLDTLGEMALAEGDHVRSQVLFEESLALCRELGNKRRIAYELRNLGTVARFQSQWIEARTRLHESLQLYLTMNEKRGIANVLDSIARLAIAEGHSQRAACLFAKAEEVRAAINAAVPAPEQSDYSRSVAAVHAALDEEAFASAWAQGCAMTMEQAVEYAMEEGVV